MEKCDKCNSDIVDGKCHCDFWRKSERQSEVINVFERGIVAYDYLFYHKKVGKVAGDHQDGNCMVLFKGDHDLCVKVKEFISNQG